MQADLAADTSKDAAEASEFRLFRPKTPTIALGLAVSHLMAKPAFAQLEFGEWSRILAGQISRKHYCFVVDRDARIVGFMGWTVTTEDKAEAWLNDDRDISEAVDGEFVVIDGWTADTGEVNRFLRDAAQIVFRDKRAAYFKRRYEDGRTRPVRLRNSRFVKPHTPRVVAQTSMTGVTVRAANSA